MNLRNLDKRWIAGAAAILVVAATILVVWGGLEPDDAPSVDELVGEASPLEVWADDDASSVSVRLDPTRGPIVELDEDTEFAITPTTDTLALDWELRRSGSTIQFVGDGELDTARARAVWTLVEGNPQAHLQISLSDVPAAWLADDLVLTAQLPAGQTDQPTDRAGAAVLWRDGDDELSFSNWSGEQIVRGGQKAPEEQASLLSFILWSQANTRGWARCEDASDELTISLTATTTLTLGASPPAANWPYSNGHQAGVIPIFDDPAHHPDDELSQATASSAQKWLGRARTLAYGHSDPSEPRYGNGGLLGHGLGGTIIIPAEFMGDDAIERFSDSLVGTGVELAPRTAADEGFDRRSRLLEDADCEALLKASDRQAPAVVTQIQLAASPKPHEAIGPGPIGHTAALEVDRLNGRLSTLLTAGLDPDRLDRLTDQQAQLVFTTPFVATRNPLVGAAAEGLLGPERGGQWTVAARFASALADLELWREAAPVSVTSLGDAVSHAQKSRRVGVEWDQSGALVVHNPHDQPIQGFTLEIAGRATANLADNRLPSRTLAVESAPETTLFWWDLQPGSSRIEFSLEGADSAPPTAVRWRVDEP
ncbi:MAG: hypothetical protein ACLFVJ_11850 [Persicimonas sp.]